MIESMNKNNQKEMTIAELAKEMREGFKNVQQEFSTVRQEISGVRSEMRQEVSSVREEMRTNLAPLKEYMNQGFTAMHESLSTTDETVKDIKGRLTSLEKGLFTEEEKEEVLAMVRHYDRWLEEDTVGKNRITLTREEYEAASRAQGFPNRLMRIPAVEIE